MLPGGFVWFRKNLLRLCCVQHCISHDCVLLKFTTQTQKMLHVTSSCSDRFEPVLSMNASLRCRTTKPLFVTRGRTGKSNLTKYQFAQDWNDHVCFWQNTNDERGTTGLRSVTHPRCCTFLRTTKMHQLSSWVVGDFHLTRRHASHRSSAVSH